MQVIKKPMPWELDEDDDGLGWPENIGDTFASIPALSTHLIKGVLRKGHKMMIAGPSKAGKSYSLIELCCAIAEGRSWLGFDCAQGRVLYVNFELDAASCFYRFKDMYTALGWEPCCIDNIDIWNLRGHTIPLDKLTPLLIRRAKHKGYAAIIIDPIYKVITGNENNAYTIARFVNYFDQIAYSCNCSVIYCHHHSKGDQSWKRSMDRASGSGVFARDVDALLDMTELELPKYRQREGITAWRVTGTLREFAPFQPVDVWFDYPLHVIEHFDTKEVAPHHELQPYQRAMNARKSKDQKLKERKRRLEAAYDICVADGTVTVSTLAEYLGVSLDTIRRSVDEHPLFSRRDGQVYRER